MFYFKHFIYFLQFPKINNGQTKGVHISKIRSLNLDDLDNETLSLLISMGNDQVNAIYEKTAPKTQSGLVLNNSECETTSEFIVVERATPKCDR